MQHTATYSLHPILREMFRDGAYYYLVVLCEWNHNHRSTLYFFFYFCVCSVLSTVNISVIVFANVRNRPDRVVFLSEYMLYIGDHS